MTVKGDIDYSYVRMSICSLLPMLTWDSNKGSFVNKNRGEGWFRKNNWSNDSFVTLNSILSLAALKLRFSYFFCFLLF